MPSQESPTESHSRTSTTHGNQGVQKGSIEANLGDLTPEQLRAYRKNRAEYDADRRSIEGWARAGFTAGDTDGDGFDLAENVASSDSAREHRVVEAEVTARYVRETPDE